MKQTLSLVWKEWREFRAYLFIGLGVFLGLPLIGGLEDWLTSSRHFRIETTPWIACFGGALAVFAAVGATCRDLSGRIEDFWRAVPVSVSRWLAAKFGMGLIVVLAACTIPILVQYGISPQSDLLMPLVFFCLFMVAVYSIAFAAGCLLRRTAQAAMMGLSGMLLLWFLPIILPPLAWMNMLEGDVTDGWEARQFAFTAGMFGLGLLGLVLAIVSVRRSWQIESGRKLIYGSISATFILLLASASFQLGTNLPILQQIDFSGYPIIETSNSNEGNGTLMTRHNMRSAVDPVTHKRIDTSFNSYRKLKIDQTGLTLGAFFTPNDHFWFGSPPDVILPDKTFVRYFPDFDESDLAKGPLNFFIYHSTDEGISLSKEKLPFQLWNLDHEQNDSWTKHIWKNRLYLLGYSRGQATDRIDHATRLAVIDISDPFKPKLLSNTPFDFRFRPYGEYYGSESPAEDNLVINLPPVPELPARERLKMVLRGNRGFEDETFCLELGNSIAEYHLDLLTDQTAKFTKIAEYKFPLFQRFLGTSNGWNLQLSNGLLYQMNGGGGAIRSLLSVFDTRGPHPLRLVGHFAAPGAGSVHPLPDGRALVGGDKLWLVGPPVRAAN